MGRTRPRPLFRPENIDKTRLKISKFGRNEGTESPCKLSLKIARTHLSNDSLSSLVPRRATFVDSPDADEKFRPVISYCYDADLP